MRFHLVAAYVAAALLPLCIPLKICRNFLNCKYKIYSQKCACLACNSRAYTNHAKTPQLKSCALCVCVCILQQVVPRRRGASSSHRSSNGRYFLISNFQMMRPRNHQLKILVEAWRLYFLKACERDDEMTRVVDPRTKHT